MKIALLFPGQGAQYVGMGKDFYERFEEAKELFERADAFLGEKLSSTIFNGPEELLQETRNSQLAIFVVGAAIWAVLKKRYHISPSYVAGLSLGEYTALYASNRISFEDALGLIQKRSIFMNEECEATEGAMCAVIGIDAEDIERTLDSLEGVWIANYNTPQQTVISGTVAGVDSAVKALEALGKGRLIPLKVHGAFHSPLMERAEKRLEPFIEACALNSSDIPLLMDVPGDFVDEKEIKKNLASQVTQSVRWRDIIDALQTKEIDLFLEIGPGKSLTAMNKKMKIRNAAFCDQVEDIEKLEELVNGGKNS